MNRDIQTLDDLIVFGKTSEYSQPTISLYFVDNGNIFLDRLVYDRYISLLRRLSEQIELTDKQYNRFKYKPDLLSMVLYETPNLEHLIMSLNNRTSYMFNQRKILLLPPSLVEEVLQEILINEKKRLDKNLVKTLE